jgi:uncharacterized protein (DUF934 family)
MPLIKDGSLAEDIWVQIADDDKLSDEYPSIVSLKRWLDDQKGLLSHNGLLGLRLKSHEGCESLDHSISNLDLITLEFPVFTDGRSYSIARILREKLGFVGELRAIGNVLRDQFLFMHRCGFNSFEVKREETVTDWLAAVTALNIWYQPTADERVSAPYLRSLEKYNVEEDEKINLKVNDL